MAISRPRRASELILARVCEMASEGKSLRTICALAGMPTEARVTGWVMYPDRDGTHDFATRFTEARRIGWMLMGENLIDEAEDDSKDTIQKQVVTKTGAVVTVISDNPMALARAKLSLETKKWVLSRVLPAVYGDKLKVEHDISDDLAQRLVAAQARLDKLPVPGPTTALMLEESLVKVERLEDSDTDTDPDDEEEDFTEPREVPISLVPVSDPVPAPSLIPASTQPEPRKRNRSI